MASANGNKIAAGEKLSLDNAIGSISRQRTGRQSVSRRDLVMIIILLGIILITANNWYLATHHLGQHDPQKNALFDALQASLVSVSDHLGSSNSDSNSNMVNQSGAYILSEFCGACTRSNAGKKSCFDIIHRKQKKLGENATLRDAAIIIAAEHKECELCDPAKCLSHYHVNAGQLNMTRSKYWRFDRSAPKFSKPTTFYLQSIPDELRIPPQRFNDIGRYFYERHNYTLKNNLIGMQYLIEYNPGLVVIPPLEKQKLPKEAYYLLSLRVTPANNCFKQDVYTQLTKDVWKAVYHTGMNHLGLALLDKNYQVIDGYETVLEIDVQLNLRRRTNVGSSLSPTFMDYRIFVLNGHIYLHANMDTVVVTQLNLSMKGSGNHERISYCDSIYKIQKLVSDEDMNKPCKLKSLYGGQNLEVSIGSQFRTIWSGGMYGKNYALFGIPNTTHPNAPDAMFAEIDIFPHHVHQILPHEHNTISRKQVFEKIWKPGTRKRRNYPSDVVNERDMKTAGNVTESRQDIPLPSFFNVDAHQDWFPGSEAPFKDKPHGGACCVSFSNDDLNLGGTRNNHNASNLLVGIGHTKVTWKPWYGKDNVPQEQKDRVPHTHYVSLFYAFDPYPPFEIRARSGYFCLGHVPMIGDKVSPTEGGNFNPHTILTRNRNLSQNFENFDCPQMSFISSFIEKADDSSKTAIGYGLNDCTGRLVEVDKKDIVKLLYPEPMEMMFEGKTKHSDN